VEPVEAGLDFAELLLLQADTSSARPKMADAHFTSNSCHLVGALRPTNAEANSGALVAPLLLLDGAAYFTPPSCCATRLHQGRPPRMRVLLGMSLAGQGWLVNQSTEPRLPADRTAVVVDCTGP
jgi:hypothetical protein